jgi:hypothetical protein
MLLTAALAVVGLLAQLVEIKEQEYLGKATMVETDLQPQLFQYAPVVQAEVQVGRVVMDQPTLPVMVVLV